MAPPKFLSLLTAGTIGEGFVAGGLVARVSPIDCAVTGTVSLWTPPSSLTVPTKVLLRLVLEEDTTEQPVLSIGHTGVPEAFFFRRRVDLLGRISHFAFWGDMPEIPEGDALVLQVHSAAAATQYQIEAAVFAAQFPN